MRHTILFAVLSIFLFACKDKKPADTAQEDKLVVKNETEEAPVKFPVYDYDGLEPILNTKDDTTYIVSFWATWCKPCIEELPDIEKVYDDYKHKNVALILVSLDMPSMWKSKLEPFVAENQLKGEVIILDDPKMNDWIPKINAEWEGGIPASLIFNGAKRQFYPHGFTYEELEKELLKFIDL